jgi:hypothetical protein
MAAIRTFIQRQIQQKLSRKRCVVVYDPLQLYDELVTELAGPPEAPTAVVVKALPGPTDALLHAWDAWADLGSSPPGPPLVIYVAVASPQGEAAQRVDPFWALAVASDTFGHHDYEQYAQLARQCYADYLPQLNELFAAPQPPPFAVLDNLGGGEKWPRLSHYFQGRESRAELLLGLMMPRTDSDAKLLASTDWLSEAVRLAEVALGVTLTENTLPTLRRKLWQLVLLGEFVMDLRCALPSALTGVERAADSARDLVMRLAPELRQQIYSTEYLEQARQLSEQLNLASYFGPLDDLGERLTFGFEDLTLLGQVLGAIRAGDLLGAAEKLSLQHNSVWRDQGVARWEVATTGLALHQAVAATRAHLQAEPPTDLARLVVAYAGPLHAPDAAQRRFEMAVGAYLHSSEVPVSAGRVADSRPDLDSFIVECRALHAALAGELQQRLLTAVEAHGWPATGMLAAREVTSQLVQPTLQQGGRRIAYFLVDALRFELAQELSSLLSEQGATVTTQAYCAQLPTSTPIGMSVLLPHDGHWTLAAVEDKVEPQAGQPYTAVPTAAARDQFWERKFGDRVRVFTQEEWLTNSAVPDAVGLLVIRSSDLDQAGENIGLAGLEQFPRALRAIRRAVLAAGAAGFREVVIATDHGFVLQPTPNDGALVAIPKGDWGFRKVRSLLGRSSEELPGTLCLETKQIGIPGPWPHFVVPRSLGSFTRGRTYAHEGLSLAEVVLPALRVQLPAPNRPAQRTRLFLRYAKAAVTTRQPMITAEAVAGDQLYDESPPVEFRITVLGSEGQVVGQLGSHSTVVDISSQLVRLPAGELARLPIRLNEAYEGPFIIRASDPDTQVELFSLPLQTQYEL